MQLIESIRFENGSFDNLDYHHDRMNKSRKELFSLNTEIDLARVLSSCKLPKDNHLYKCRIIYNKEIRSVEFGNYQKRKINSLKVIRFDNIDYKYKFRDRRSLDILYNKKGKCDDIIIIRNGKITDSYFANLVFYDGKNWITPSEPLLEGTRRNKLIDDGIVTTDNITSESLKYFKKVRLINAMLRFEDNVDVDIKNIQI